MDLLYLAIKTQPAMPTFPIDLNLYFGTAHYGDVTADGYGEVELSDEDVQKLVNLIRENGGETDVEKLQISEKYPDIFSTLDDAYYELASQTAYIHWVNAGYDNGWYELSDDEIAENCEAFGFKFEFDPDEFKGEDGVFDEDAMKEAKSEALYRWIKEYRSPLNDYDDALFLAEVFNLEPEDYNGNLDYSVELPDEIIAMANNGQ